MTTAEAKTIQAIHDQNQQWYETVQGKGALRDLQRVSPYSWLYVAELLQNAIDAGASHISLKRTQDDCLILEHDGKSFDEADVRAISVRGATNKGIGTVGFMGLGFKSVFRCFSKVDISSRDHKKPERGAWQFSFEVPVVQGALKEKQRDWIGCVTPRVDEDIAWPTETMACRFMLQGRLDGLDPIADDIFRVFSDSPSAPPKKMRKTKAEDLLLLPLLARQGLKELKWDNQKWILDCHEEQTKHDKVVRFDIDALDEDGEEEHSWALFSTSYIPSEKTLTKFLEHREIISDDLTPDEVERVKGPRYVDLFCAMGRSGPVPPKKGRAYALLPTGEEFPIGMHIQADWLLVTNRQELMESVENPWHQEILVQAGPLLCAYLEWASSSGFISEKTAETVFRAIPRMPEKSDPHHVWLSEVAAFLKTYLRDMKFLPVRSEEGVRLAAPEEACVAPKELEYLDDRALKPWVLFGERVVSSKMLGNRAAQFFKKVELLHELTNDEFVRSANPDQRIKKWANALGDCNSSYRYLLKFIKALGELQEKREWALGQVCCLPTEEGAWTCLDEATRLPEDWGAVHHATSGIKVFLRRFLDPKEHIVSWELEESIATDQDARAILDMVHRQDIHAVVNRWWRSLGESPSEAEIGHVLQFTSWARSTTPAKPTLVKRILCRREGSLRLLPWDGVALLDPYTDKCRRCFYPDSPHVSSRYLKSNPKAPHEDWKAFFTAAGGVSLLGDFRLREIREALSTDELRDRMRKIDCSLQPPDTELPGGKVTWTGKNLVLGTSRPTEFKTDEYLWVDFKLPKPLEAILRGPVTKELFQAINTWIREGLSGVQDMGPDASRVRVILLQPGRPGPGVWNQQIGDATWVRKLNEKAWVYDREGRSPDRPERLLRAYDEARPTERVAGLHEDVITFLAEHNVVFDKKGPPVNAGSPEDKPKEQNQQKADQDSDDPDLKYRQAVASFEEAHGRIAEAKDSGKDGYDMESYELGQDGERVLVRRIEVKGIERPWEGDATRAISKTQFRHAFNHEPDKEGYDYWLYVVENRTASLQHPDYNVIPIRNPARRSGSFEFRADTWLREREDD